MTQIDILRRQTPAERLATGAGLLRMARAVKLGTLRRQHPDWSEEQLQRELAGIFLRSRTD